MSMKLKNQGLPQEVQELAKQHDESVRSATQKENNKKGPMWLSQDQDGDKFVNITMLGNEIIEEMHLFSNSFNANGYYYSSQDLIWRRNFESAVKALLTAKLEEVGMWTKNRRDQVLTFIKDKSYRDENKDVFETKKNIKLIHFSNGIYNMETDSLSTEPDPQDHLMNYHELALDMQTDPIETERWYEESFKDASYTMTLWTGYQFYRDYSKYQNFVFLQGDGGDGKSTFLRYLNGLVGQENVTNMSIQDLANNNKNTFLTSNLFHKEMNTFADMPEDFLKNTAMLKTLSGGDRITVQEKNGHPYQTENYAKLTGSANHLPSFSDDTDGWKRRVMVIRYHAIENFGDKFNWQKIMNERGAWIYHCIKELYSFMTGDGKYKKSLPQTETTRLDRDEWLKENNTVQSWLLDQCEIDPEKYEKVTYLYPDYKNYCMQIGRSPISKPKFDIKLKGLGYDKVNKRVDGGQQKSVSGFRLNPDREFKTN